MYRKGFTLVELLIVVGLLAVLGSATVLILNPVELLNKGRDRTRISDINILNKALNLYNFTGGSFGVADRVYISLPDTAGDNCNSATGGTGYSLPPLPSGKTYWCVSSASYRKIDGTGWIPVDFASIPAGSPVSRLPIDPINSASENLYYTYTMGGSWMLTAMLQGKNNTASIGDGGAMPGVYEVGTNLTLGPFTRDLGLVGHWKFEEGSGTVAKDSSGRNFNGTLTSGPTWTAGRSGGGILFDGLDDYIQVNNFWNTLGDNYRGPLSYAIWVKPGNATEAGSIIADNNDNEGYIQVDIPNNRVRYQFMSASDQTGITNPTGWHFLAMTATGNGGTMVKYMDDGQSSVSLSNCTDVYCGPDGYLRIGGGASLGFFHGIIDEVRIYTRALSEAEIKAIYNATR